jgi:hypothetical protein
MSRLHTIISLAALALFTFATGCTHRMEITNLDNYQVRSAPPARTARAIGITTSNATDPRNERYVSCIVEALQKNGNLSRVIYPYNRSMHEDLVDSVVDIAVNPRYDGRGSNFWVNFPGFLIFAPAIWGYGYTADIRTDFSVATPTGDLMSQQSVTTQYEFRQADMGRTWTEVSWFEVGIIAMVGGVVFTGYDTGVTDEFISTVSPNYGSFMAQKIVGCLPDKKVGPSTPAQGASPTPGITETPATAPTKTI